MASRKLKDPGAPNDTGTHKKSDFLVDALHIFVLFSFALAQPLFDLLSRYPEFFVSRKSEPIDIILFIVMISVLLPAIAVLFEALAGLFARRIRKDVHWFMVAILTGVIALQVLIKLFKFPGVSLIAMAALLGVAATIAYVRLRPAKIFLTVLCPAIIIFPALFIFNSPVHKVLFPGKAPSAIKTQIDNPAPIIMVVFDEFPVVSLMDENEQIDPALYPNFAAFTKDAYWFRNATNVAAQTTLLLPAILTGMYPDPSCQPMATDYPNNLFTLLGELYDQKVFETQTQLCPSEISAEEMPRGSLGERLYSLWGDLCIVYLHIILPSDFKSVLPVVTQGWMHFKKEGPEFTVTAKKQNLGSEIFKKLSLKVRRTDRYRQFSHFLDSMESAKRPSFYFMHILLPHRPWDFLPSGKRYNGAQVKGFTFGGARGAEIWGKDEWLAIQAYQRHLLQVGLTDRLLGKLIKKLKDLNLYERSLIVVTADHGISFRTNNYLREVTEMNKADIMCVPLFIKAPNQDQGVTSDRNVQTIDILPTIADMLGVQVPWPMDGRSALDQSQAERKEVLFLNPKRQRLKFTLESIYHSRQEALKLKLNAFGKGGEFAEIFKIGPHKKLIGKNVHYIPDVLEGNVRFEIDQDFFYADVNPESSFMPSHIGGRVVSEGNTGDEVDMAISVNGVIQAVTRSLPLTKGEADWSVMVPETAFAPGKNDIEAFIVAEAGDRLSLERARKQRNLTYSYSIGQGKKLGSITSSDGESIPVVSNAVKGYLAIAEVRDGRVVVDGWAADVKKSQLPEAIIIFESGKFIFSGRCNVLRPDVARTFGNDMALQGSGFRYVFPISVIKDESNSKVRVFALSREGIASELYHPKESKITKNGPSIGKDSGSARKLWIVQTKAGSKVNYTLSKSIKGKEKTSSITATSIPVILGFLEGHLDIAKVENKNVVFSGWAADVKNSQLPEAIIVFVNGRFVYSGKCNLDRPDVAKAYTNPALRKSGFKYVFPLSSFEDLANCEVRIFFVTKKGLASEVIYPKGYKWGRK